MTELVLAIDAGTTGVRSMFFDWVEQRAESWWEKSCETIQRCIKEENIRPEQIVAISVTNQRETVVPINKDGVPLRNAIVWQDRRTVKQCQWIEEKIPPAQVYSTTGLTIDPYFTAPKILWIRENEKTIYDEADKFLLVHDFLIYIWRTSDRLFKCE